MKSMKLTGIRAMEMMETPSPKISLPNDVLIKMSVVGVCGSDVHYYEDGQIGSQIIEYPFAEGHEGAGIVEEIGPEVSKVKVGDRIAIDPAIFCGKCDQCQAGREHTCRELRFLGCPGQIEGCLSEYIVMPEGACFPIPDHMTMEQAAISEPLAIGVYAVEKAMLDKGARIGILGSGPIGLCTLLAAKAEGMETAYVTDKIDERLGLAQTMGADWTGNPTKTNIVNEISQAEPLLLDAVFECCGDQDAIDQALQILKPGGTLLIIGIPTVDKLSFTMDLMRRREIRVQNIRRQVGCVQKALDLIANKEINVDPMATHHFDFKDSKTAFDLVNQYKDGVSKAIIHI